MSVNIIKRLIPIYRFEAENCCKKITNNHKTVKLNKKNILISGHFSSSYTKHAHMQQQYSILQRQCCKIF